MGKNYRARGVSSRWKSRKFEVCASLALSMCALMTLGEAFAQTPSQTHSPTSLEAEAGVPRTPKGRPDLQGVWESPFLGGLMGTPMVTPSSLVITEEQSKQAQATMIQRMANSALVVLDPEILGLMGEAKGFPIVRGERRSRTLVTPADGKLPLTEQAQAELTRAQRALSNLAGPTDNPEDRAVSERCMALGALPPIASPNTFSPLQFVQTADYLVIRSEFADEVRIIPFTRTHGRPEAAAPHGDSIAYWDRDTLVIETRYSPASHRVRPSSTGGLIVNFEARVIERFTRISADELIYQFTVEDPAVFTAPWLGEYSFFRAAYNLNPNSCHEGNYGLTNILAGSRYEDEHGISRPEWSKALADKTNEPAVHWTISIATLRDVRSWAILSAKDDAGLARVGMRIERATATAGDRPALSELNVFEIDCASQRLRQVAVTTFSQHNLIGMKSEGPVANAWLGFGTRPAIAGGIGEACR